MNREALYVLHAMLYQQQSIYGLMWRVVIGVFIFAVFGRDVFITVCISLVALAVAVIVVRFIINVVRSLWRASEAIRYKLSDLFNLNVLIGCLVVYFMGSVIIYSVYEGIKSFLGMT